MWFINRRCACADNGLSSISTQLKFWFLRKETKELIFDKEYSSDQNTYGGNNIHICFAKLSYRLNHQKSPHPMDEGSHIFYRMKSMDQRNFSVAKPIKASTSEMIQKRMTMVDSAQPFFS